MLQRIFKGSGIWEKKVVIFAFANSKNDLPSIITELEGIQQILRTAKDFIEAEIIYEATIEKVVEVLQNPGYLNRIKLLHFAGHASHNHLLFNDETYLQGTRVNGESFAQILGTREDIKLVFLNGCATFGMVKSFNQAGIDHIIATQFSIPDSEAAKFAVHFYKELLLRQSSILKAFNFAKHVQSIYSPGKYEVRDIILINKNKHREDNQEKQLLWGLYSRKGINPQNVYLLSKSIRKNYLGKIFVFLLIAISISVFIVDKPKEEPEVIKKLVETVTITANNHPESEQFVKSKKDLEPLLRELHTKLNDTDLEKLLTQYISILERTENKSNPIQLERLRSIEVEVLDYINDKYYD